MAIPKKRIEIYSKPVGRKTKVRRRKDYSLINELRNIGILIEEHLDKISFSESTNIKYKFLLGTTPPISIFYHGAYEHEFLPHQLQSYSSITIEHFGQDKEVSQLEKLIKKYDFKKSK